MRTVWFLLLPNTHILDLAGPLQAMASCAELGLAPLTTRCIAASSQINCFQNLSLAGLEPLPAELAAGDWLFVIGHKLLDDAPTQAALEQAAQWLEQVAGSTAELTICSVCTGAFVLGQAGLLDHKQCTTHHAYVAQLQQRYPRAKVLSNHLFVQDDNLYSSAGVSTGIDLSLHVIAEKLGRQHAERIAQDLVIYRRRADSDPQLGSRELTRNHIHPLIHQVQDHLHEQFCSPITVEQLASRFNLSYRHLARLFRSNTGITLHTYLRQLRIEQAKLLLSQQRIAIELLAERCGFASSHALRQAWRKEMTLTPLQYRNSLSRSQ
jgi:transcriptional regulator GlxA family with amidase domain